MNLNIQNLKIHDSGKDFMVNDMSQKNYNFIVFLVVAMFVTIFPHSVLSDDGIIYYDKENGRCVLAPERMDETAWKKLVQDDNLQEMVLGVYSNWFISEKQIHALKQFINVHTIRFPKCQNINVEVIQTLKNLPKLRNLMLDDCQDYSVEVYHELSSVTQLVELSIYGDALTMEGMLCLSQMLNLQKLEIGVRQELTPQQIDMLKNLKNLRILKIRNPLISNQTLQSYGKILSLEELYLSWMGDRTPTTISSEKPILISEKVPSALEVKIPVSNSESITKEGIQGLASLRNLRILILSLPSRTVNGELEPLFTMSKLECLALEGEFRNEEIRAIYKLTNLQDLTLCSSLMTVDVVKLLVKLNNLQKLKLLLAPDAPNMSDELVILSSLKLRLINLSGNPCVNDSIIYVLSQFPHLKYIDLYGTNVSPPNCRIFEEENVPFKMIIQQLRSGKNWN